VAILLALGRFTGIGTAWCRSATAAALR